MAKSQKHKKTTASKRKHVVKAQAVKTTKKVVSNKPAKITTAAKPVTSGQSRFRLLVKWVGIPLLIYLAFFCLYASTWILHFNTHFFTDQGDGFQNVWNFWWINKAVTQLHVSPWHTNLLHYPYGTTLIAQTLNPFNGFVAIALLKFFSLVQAYNIMVIFSFVFGGMTTFWLCYYFSRKYIPALIGGFIFTFSSYHFAHAVGHMQLVSLEWIPLFILLWWKLLTKPRYRLAVGAAIVLLLVLFCDYYYFLYSIVGAGLSLVYLWRSKQLANLKLRQTYGPFILFLIVAGLITLPLPVALLLTNSHDPLQGSHDARVFSTDLFSVILDGGFWHFASLTHWYWKHIRGFTAESSVYLGLSVITLLVISLWKRNKLNRHVVFWLWFGFIFGVLSLGPRLMVVGYSINHAPMPYAILQDILPELKLSGVPVRMMVMVMLAAAILSSIVLAKLDLTKRKGQLVMALFFAVLVFEMWPATMPLNIASKYPAYVGALAKLPPGAVVDDGAINTSWQLYDQTIDDHPIAFGYISRTPTSVADKDNVLTITILRHQYDRLCRQFKIRYYTTPAYRPLQTTLPVIYNDHKNLIYDLKNSPNC